MVSIPMYVYVLYNTLFHSGAFDGAYVVVLTARASRC